jgi:hypothetical protein
MASVSLAFEPRIQDGFSARFGINQQSLLRSRMISYNPRNHSGSLKPFCTGDGSISLESMENMIQMSATTLPFIQAARDDVKGYVFEHGCMPRFATTGLDKPQR